MFASLDAWFDELLDSGFDTEQDTHALEWIEHIYLSNHNLLESLPQESNRVLAMRQSGLASKTLSFDELRFALRDQLFQSLCLVDYLDESFFQEPSSDDKHMHLHDILVLITEHLRYHLDLLDVGGEVEDTTLV